MLLDNQDDRLDTWTILKLFDKNCYLKKLNIFIALNYLL